MIGGAVNGSAMAGASDDPAGDMSPVLLIESGPSDNPNYRRMVFVKFLDGETVRVAYKAYNRSEFIQITDNTPLALRVSCANAPSATLEEIDAFEMREADARDAGEMPSVAQFCIKGIEGWEAGNRARYLDPIFNGMPLAATLND